ncbi:MAG: phospholipase D-like domain-containing protein [Blastocatellia bacterium]
MNDQSQQHSTPACQGEGPAPSLRILPEQAFLRAAGAPLIAGNSVRVLKDAPENYPAWLEAIEAAERTIHFESYIIHEDEQGQTFADALIAKAKAGVRVRLIYDWLGALSATSNNFWRRLRDAGVEVRCFNPLCFESLLGPLDLLSRDHRKMLAVDSQVGFVTGLCVGQMWVGDPQRGVEPWRDTGVEVRGPAVAEIERAFAKVWAVMGQPIPEDELPEADAILPAGDVALRVVASMPNTTGLYRLDQIIAAATRETLWLTDAYFAATTPYIQALRAAAMDGVDVRLLAPQATDIPVMRALSRSSYRPLIEAGVRVYEWNGPMIHAKTAVADGHWARIGSTNLNIASWLSNWELDVVIEDDRIGQQMEQMYLKDLENATEIVLTERKRMAPTVRHGKRRLRERIGTGSSSRAAAGAVNVGRTISAAIQPAGAGAGRSARYGQLGAAVARTGDHCDALAESGLVARGRSRSLDGDLLVRQSISFARQRNRQGRTGCEIRPERNFIVTGRSCRCEQRG